MLVTMRCYSHFVRLITRRAFFDTNTFPYLKLSKYFSKHLGKWELPDGHESGINIYNSYCHQNVPLLLKRKGIATWYMCGPTVYADSHIGHASCYIKFDIIRRIMESMFNIDVILLIGITDIDDKIIQKSNQIKSSISEVAKKYELDFFQDMQTMRVKVPTITARVTECIPLIISFCQKLIDKEYAYCTTEGNVYFMVSKGVSSEVLGEMQEETQQIIDPLKKDQRDFALWKSAKSGEPYWSSPWGNGRPGWHIECSTIASNVFGCEIDIHSGGQDLIFPHHTNEKSQSEAFHGCQQWVNYWIHAGLLQIQDDVKMSKSLGNSITIKDFLKQHSVNDFRILCLQSLYRNNISFGDETLLGAKRLHRKLHNFINEIEIYMNGELACPSFDENGLLKKLSDTKESVKSFFASDFNTSQALLCITDLIDHIYKLLTNSTGKENDMKNSQNIIALSSCYIFIDQTLENLGVHIRCKKRLPNIYYYAMDAIVEIRKEIRELSLQKNADYSDTKFYLKATEDAFHSLDDKLSMIGINIKTHIGMSEEISLMKYTPLSELPKELRKNFFGSLEAVQIFHKQVVHFIRKLEIPENGIKDSHISIDTPDQKNMSSNLKQKKSKNRYAPILQFCDDLRVSLEITGIAVKDRGSNCTWYPTVENGDYEIQNLDKKC